PATLDELSWLLRRAHGLAAANPDRPEREDAARLLAALLLYSAGRREGGSTADALARALEVADPAPDRAIRQGLEDAAGAPISAAGFRNPPSAPPGLRA